MVGEELLDVVRRCHKGLRGREVDHVIVPRPVTLVREDRCEARHDTDVGIPLHAHHEDSLAQRALNRAVLSVSAVSVGCILSDVYFWLVARVSIVFVEAISHPRV